MKAAVCIFVFSVCVLVVYASGIREIPLAEVQAIALRNATGQWGTVYAAEPIPYYDRQGSLAAWQFNFSLGKPFPGHDELQQLCRNSSSKLWNESWNSEGFANLLMGARSDKPVVIAFSKGLSYDFSYLTEMEQLAAKQLGKSFKLERMVQVNMGSRWFVVSSGGKEYYIKAFAPAKVVTYEEFLTLTEGLETPLKTMDFSDLWQEYLGGRTDDRAAVYIPYPEKMPFYQWVVGCSPCSGSMLAAWWDNMSAVATDDYSNLVKYHYEGWDSIQSHTDFHITDAVNSIGYYMGTNDEGGTPYYNIDDGMQDFFNSRDYGVWTDSDDLEWEFLWDYDDLYYAARGQINAGKPTLLAIPGHSICGMGYNNSGHYLLLHDPNSYEIESWHQSEFNMVTYVHPSTTGWSSHVEIITPDGGQYWHSDGGGEQWYANDVYEIKWAGDFDAGTYAKLWYHLDKGYESSGWTVISANTPNDGSYDWLIPAGISSTKCRIKIEIYTDANQLIGSDSSYGNFTISSGGSSSALVSGTPVNQNRNPVYYRVPDNENSWVAVGTLRHNDSPVMGLKLYDSINLETLLASSEYSGVMNLIAIDRNHLPDNEYGLKVYNVNGYVGGFTEFEGGNNQLSNGLNTGLSWSDLHSVKMWDLQLNPGTYLITLDMISGSHNLGLALFSSQGASYIKNLSQALAYSDFSPAGGDESFTVDITNADRYGLCVFCKDYILTGANSHFTINVGTPGLWTGSVSRAWNVAGNWSNNQVPTSTSNIVIPSGLYNYPFISGGLTADCRSVTIQDGSILEVAQGTFSVHGGYTRVYGKIKISNAAAVLDLNGHLVWNTGSEFEETAAGTIYLGGNWDEKIGSTVEISLTNVIFDGSEDSIIYLEDGGNHFGNLTIAKSGSRWTSVSEVSQTSLRINGNLTVQSGSVFHSNSIGYINVSGILVSAGGLLLNQGRLRFVSGTTQYITTAIGDIINDLELINMTTLELNSNLSIHGSMYITSGVVNAHSRSITVHGNWEQSPYFNSYVADAAGSVIFAGDQNSTCTGVNFKTLVINKSYSAEVVIDADKQVQCTSLDWTSGVIRVNGGSLLASDLADLNIKGSYILESGIIDLYQDSAQFVDLNADLNISGGTFTVHGGYPAASEWAYTEGCQITMTGGALNFADNGIYLSDTGHYLGLDISGGEIQTSKDFKVERPGFNPTGGTVMLYGSGNSILHVASPSALNNLSIYKNGRDSDPDRTNMVTVDSNTNINRNCEINSGILEINNCRFVINGSLSVLGALKMDAPTDILEVNGGVIWYSGSSGTNLSGGLIISRGNVFLNEGCDVQVPASVTIQMSGGISINLAEPTAQLGTVVWDTTSNPCYFNSSDEVILNGDLVIKPNATLEVAHGYIIHVSGKIDIWNLGTLIMRGPCYVSTHNLYNSGQLILDSGCIGELAIANTFLQYSEGSLGLHGGSITIDAPYSGTYYSFGGTTSMTGGTLKITNNGMQVGATGFTFSGGTIKLGWGFQANSPNSFHSTVGELQFIGTLSSTIFMGSGNYFPTVTINKSGSTGSVYLGTDLTIKQNLSLSGGKLYVNQHTLTCEKNVAINSGYLYGDNANDVIQVGGSWLNSSGSANFIEGSGLVKFISSISAKRIESNESFYNLHVATDAEFVYVSAGVALTVGGNLEILSGKFRPLDGTVLNVTGNLMITGQNSWFDQNFRRETANTQVHVYGNCIINGGKFYSLDTNGNIPDDILTIDGELNMTGGELNTLDLNMTVHGNFSTTTASYLMTRGASFINDAPYTGAWQYVNCPWVTYGITIEFPNKGLQFVSGASLDNNSFTEIKLGRGLYATASGVFANDSGTFEFIGTNQANINLGGGNALPAIKINKTGTSVVLSTHAVISRDLIIQSGNFNSNNFQLTVKGSWTNNVGTSGYSSGTSEVIFDTTSYSASITGNQTFYKLTFSHTDTTKGITMNSSTSTVSNDLTVNSGRFTIGSSSVLQVNGNASVANNALLYLQGQLKLRGNLTDNNPTVTYQRGFYAPQSSLFTLNGTSAQAINVATAQINLGCFTLDKASGSFQPVKGIVCSGDVTVQNGTWGYGSSGLSHSFAGALSIISGASFTDNTGTIIFTGSSNTILSNAGTANFKNITVNKSSDTRTPSSISLGSNLTLSSPGSVTINSGILNLAGYTLQTAGDIAINSTGTLAIGAGGILKLPNNANLNITNGGNLQTLGSSTTNATITHTSGNYHLNIQSGGSISAERCIFEYTGSNGVNIMDGALVDPAHSFAYCTFRYGYSSGSLMTINNAQSVTIDHASFPSGATSFYNVSKTLDQGTVQFTNETGGWAGSGHENDMYSRINWSSDIPEIQVNPPLFNFGEVLYSQSSTRNMLISNPGSAVLHGTITTPACFSIAPLGRTEAADGSFISASKADYEHSRNVLSYQVPIGGSATFTITFTPEFPQYYSGNIIVSHNAVGAPINVFVDGYGVGARISADPRNFNIDITPGEIAHRALMLSNTGVDSLSYSAWVYYAREDRNTLLYTGFEDSCPPTGWTEVQVAGTEGDWAQAATTVHPYGTAPYAGNYLGYFNSYSAHVNNRRRLQSPELDVSDYTGLSLSFWMFHDSGYPSYYDTLQVQVSVNGGEWVNAGNYILRCTMPYEWRQHIIDLSSYDRSANLRVGFLAKSGYGNDMHIDEVFLTGNYQMPTDWITMNGAATIWGELDPEDPPVPIDIAIDSEGLPSGWYMNQVRFMSNDPGNPDLPVYLNIRIGTPDYTFSPPSLDFGDLTVGETDSLDFTIINTGQIGLSGTITAPPGFYITLSSGIREQANELTLSQASQAPRNSTDFYIYPGISLSFRLGFIPTEAIDYTGQLIISTNTGVDEYLPVSGSGVSLPAIANGTVTDIGIASATYHGEVISTGNQVLTQRGIVWNTYGNPTLIDDNIILSPGQQGEFTIPLTSLVHSQTYYLKAFAENALGTVLGEQILFTTPGPELIVSPDSLPNFGHVALGQHSVPQHITVSGVNLVDMVSFTCGNGFQLSLSESGTYGNEVILYPTDYILASTNVYIRFSPTVTGEVTELFFPMTVGASTPMLYLLGTGVTSPTVETATVTLITQETALINARIVDDGLDPVSQCGICWNTSGLPTLADSHTQAGAQSGWFTGALSGLTSSTEYFARAYATNLAGTVYGNQVSFHTLAAPSISIDISHLDPFGRIVVGSISQVDTLIVAATELQQDLVISAPSGFQLSLTPTGRSFSSTLSLSPIIGTISSTPVFVRFAPLQGGNMSDYLSAASASLDSLVMVYGVGIVAPAVITGTATEIGIDSAVLGGSIVSAGWDDIQAAGICYGTAPNPDINGLHADSGIILGDYSVTIYGLSPNAIYFYRAYATNGAGTAYGAELSFSTLMGSLDAPQNLSISIVDGIALLSWDAVLNASSYSIYRSSDPYATEWGAPVGLTSATTWADPEAGTMYFYRVIASSQPARGGNK